MISVQSRILLLGTIVLVIIIALKHGTKGITSASSVLIGVIAGYIIAGIMGVVLPTTAVNADGVEYTKAWVLNWDKVAPIGFTYELTEEITDATGTVLYKPCITTADGSV